MVLLFLCLMSSQRSLKLASPSSGPQTTCSPRGLKGGDRWFKEIFGVAFAKCWLARSERLVTAALNYSHFYWMFFFSVLPGYFSLPFLSKNWIDPLHHLISCWFYIMYSSLQLLYSSVLSIFLWFLCLFCVFTIFFEVLTRFICSSFKSIEHLYNQCFKLSI